MFGTVRDSDPLCGTDRGTQRLGDWEMNDAMRGGTVPSLNTLTVIKRGPHIEASKIFLWRHV